MEQLKVDTRAKHPHLVKKKVLLHKDNALVHTSSVVVAKLHELDFELLLHAPYSPDLTARFNRFLIKSSSQAYRNGMLDKNSLQKKKSQLTVIILQS